MKKLTFLMLLLGLIFVSAGDAMAVGDETVELFKNKNFEDGPMLLGVLSKDVMDDGWDNTISSIKVGKNLKVTLFNDPNQNREKPYIVLYPGEYKDLRMDYDGNPWNDKISSIKVEKLSDPNLPLIKLTYGRSGGIFTQMIGLDGNEEFKKVDSLLLNDDLISAEVPPEYKVTFYPDSEYGGRPNTEPVSGRTVNMSEFGLKDKVSSIKIEWNKYKLDKVDMKELSRTNLNAEEAPITVGDGKIDNPSAATSSIEEAFETTYTSSATTSWENTTSVGFTYTQTVKAEAAVPGLGSAGAETSFAASIANEFAFGKQETRTQEKKITKSITVSAPPYSSIGVYFEIIPTEVEYDVTYTYVSVDDKGEPDKKGKDRVIKGKMKVKSPGSITLRTRDINAPTNPQPAPADQGMMARAMEWIKERPCRLYEFFGGKDPAWMCGGANDTPNTNTSVQPSNTSTNTK